MRAFFLTWNPDRWEWPDYNDAVASTTSGQTFSLRWSTGNTKSIEPGDRAFLFQLGRRHGLIGSGRATSVPSYGEHWDTSRNDQVLAANIEFDILLPQSAILSRDELERLVPGVNWRQFFASGIRVPPDSVSVLADAWSRHIEGVRQRGTSATSFITGATYVRKEIHNEYGGQTQGGISTPKNYPMVFLFTGATGRLYGYNDGFQDDGRYFHAGHGQVGDMKMAARNLAVKEHSSNGETLHLFEQLGKGECRYVGEASYLDHHTEPAPDRNGEIRKAIVFELDVRTTTNGSDRPYLAKRRESQRRSLWTMSLQSIREKALERSANDATPALRKAKVHNRSEYVKVYVRRRANGRCEACGGPAPFETSDGHPYLEPHHTQRLADEGPDDPRWVAAICPNCHTRIHYGKDGDEFNAMLIRHIQELERYSFAGQ